MFKSVVTTLLMAASILGLVACAGGTGTSNTVDVTTTDFKYDPMTWTVAAGKPVTVNITNHGATKHEWVLVKQGAEVTLPFNDDDESKVVWEIEADAGKTNTGTFTAPSEPGTYTIVCGIPAHL